MSIAPESPLYKAKQYFLFSYYGQGMNFREMARLEWGNIVEGRVFYQRVKTGERIGRRETKSSSRTISEHQESKTVHEKEKLILTPQETMDLHVGEFLRSVAASDAPFFRMNLRPIGAYHPKLRYDHFSPLPLTTARVDAQAHFHYIRHSVQEMVRAGKQEVQ